MDSMDPVATTAHWMAAERARETARRDRLFDDALAEALAGREGFDLMARMEAGGLENPVFPIRTRFFDDAIQRLVADEGIGQVVLVAAGLDARAYRMDLPTVFEIDLPDLLKLKGTRLAAASAQPRCPRVAVGVDLTSEWADDLITAGFRTTTPSVFVAEGLLGYLEEPEVHRLLDVLAALAAPGSFLLCDVGGRRDVDAMAFWFQRLADNGIVGGRFGTDDPAGLLAAHEWRAQVTRYGDEEANFGRWPFPPVPHDDAKGGGLIVATR